MDILTDNINNFNEAVSKAVERLSMPPQDFSGGIYNMVLTINEALIPLGIAFLLTYFIFSFYDKAINFKMNDYKIFASTLLSFILSVVFLMLNLDILNMFFAVSNTVLHIVTIPYSSGTLIIDPDVINSLWDGISFWKDIGMFFEMVFSQILLVIILFIANFIILFVTISRMFEIYIYMAFAPIPMCTFVNDNTKNIGKSYITNFCAVVLKSSVICFILQMYQMFIIDIAPALTSDSATYFWATAISGLLLIVLIISAEKMSEKIVGQLR